ncbi:shikimate kinase [Pseudooceanicola sp. 502str34]
MAENGAGGMGWTLKKTVVLVGMMGAGKTAVGKALAAELEAPFVDSDAEIEAAAQMTISEIFARDGEGFFRKKETQVIGRLLDLDDTGGRILSTGGGAFMQPQNREMISRRGVSVWLKADLDLLWRRVKHRDSRPLLRAPDPYGTLKGLYEARVPTYALADLTVETQPAYSIDETCALVVEALQSRPDVLEKR